MTNTTEREVPLRSSPRAMLLGLAAFALCILWACQSVVDPALPDQATPFTPPAVYASWWAAVEQCSGLSGSLAGVNWFVVPGASIADPSGSGDVSGYWSKGSNRIVLAQQYTMNGGLVRHEMLHALIQDTGHPRLYFQQKCGGVVTCVQSCLTGATSTAALDTPVPRRSSTYANEAMRDPSGKLVGG